MFAPRFVYGDLDLTDYPFALPREDAEGLNLGNPQPVSTIVASLLADGEIVEVERDENRELRLEVLIGDTDLAALAQAEALLVAECRKQRNTLLVEAGDGFGPTTVFDTFRARVEWERDDRYEQENLRKYVLTIPALPFTRSLEPVVDDAGTPPSDGGTLLYNCESTTGWSQYFSGGFGSAYTGSQYSVDATTFSEGAGSMRAKPGYYYTYGSGGPESFGWADQIGGLSLSTGSGGYLSVSIKGSHGDPILVGRTADDDGILMTTAENGDQGVTFFKTSRDANGFVRYVWPIEGGLTVTRIRFYAFQNQQHFTSQPYLWYDDVRLIESATTDKQVIKQLQVKGSARTTGSLLVAAPDDTVALGSVMVASVPTGALPAGYTPDMRRWITNGTTTADSAAPSGSYLTPASSYSTGSSYPVFDVPASMFTPGPYVAVAGGKPTTTTPFVGVQAQLRVGSTDSGVLSKAENRFAGMGTSAYQFLPLGTLYLPPTPVLSPSSDVKVRMLFAATDFRIDNLYLIPAWQVGGRPVADFSIVDCGTGTVGIAGASSHLWIDSPSAEQPQGGYWRGPDASKQLAQAAWPDAVKPGLHVFEPGGLTAFVVSTNAQGPRVELTYFPAWHGSAAE